MELKEMIKVMQHYDNGGEIIYKVKDDEYCSWMKCNNPIWDWFEFEYKIKREKVTIEKWLCKSGENSFYIHEGTDADGLEKVKLLETYEVEL